MIRLAVAQAAPASWRRPDAASASAATTRAAIHASLWPPPAKSSAIAGFQPTSTSASAGLRESRAASSAAASIAAAASALYVHAAASADEPSASASGSEASVNAGP